MQPDIILLDVGMPHVDGIQAARIIRQSSPKSRIVFVTQEGDVDVRNAAMEVGAVGYVLKTHAGKDLLDVITATLCRLGNSAPSRRSAMSCSIVKETPHA